MTTNFRMLGRMGPEQIFKDTIFYDCWAGDHVKYIAITDAEEVRPDIWEWKAKNIQWSDIPDKDREVVTFTFRIKHPGQSPYIFDYPAYVPLDRDDSHLIY